MSDHTYKSVELTGTSTKTIDDAVTNAITRASKTLHNIRWFEVVQIRGAVQESAVSQWQVVMKVGFTLD